MLDEGLCVAGFREMVLRANVAKLGELAAAAFEPLAFDIFRNKNCNGKIRFRHGFWDHQ